MRSFVICTLEKLLELDVNWTRLVGLGAVVVFCESDFEFLGSKRPGSL
jgi:hypothetical protein